MATITHDDLAVCDDCAQILANGEFDGECEHGDATAHADAMTEIWGEGAAGILRMVLACGEDEEECDSFSRRGCDGCGSSLAGGRHAAVVFGE